MNRCYKCEALYQRNLRYDAEEKVRQIQKELTNLKLNFDSEQMNKLENQINKLESENGSLKNTIAIFRQLYDAIKAASGKHRVCPECWHAVPDGSCAVCGPLPEVGPSTKDITNALCKNSLTLTENGMVK